LVFLKEWQAVTSTRAETFSSTGRSSLYQRSRQERIRKEKRRHAIYGWCNPNRTSFCETHGISSGKTPAVSLDIKLKFPYLPTILYPTLSSSIHHSIREFCNRLHKLKTSFNYTTQTPENKSFFLQKNLFIRKEPE
jgi:hypothetical protein